MASGGFLECFTPWHGILYSGYAAVAGFMLAAMIRNRAAGYPWDRALPLGYRTARFGIVMFAFSGAGDLIWLTYLIAILGT